MIIKLETLIKPDVQYENLLRLARFLDIEVPGACSKPELALMVFEEINAPSVLATEWMKPGSWREEGQ